MTLKQTLLALSALAVSVIPAAGPSASAQVPAALTPDVYVVMFRSDTCPPCKIVEPRLSNVINTLNDQRIEPVLIDYSNAYAQESSAHRAFDRDLVRYYNGWFGVTGFAAIIDGDTKQVLGCVNRTYDSGAMSMHIKNLQRLARNNQMTMDLTCPSMS